MVVRPRRSACGAVRYRLGFDHARRCVQMARWSFKPRYFDGVCVRTDVPPRAAEQRRPRHILAAIASGRSDVLFALLLAFFARAGEQSELARDPAGRAIPPHYRRDSASELQVHRVPTKDLAISSDG